MYSWQNSNEPNEMGWTHCQNVKREIAEKSLYKEQGGRGKPRLIFEVCLKTDIKKLGRKKSGEKKPAKE